MEEHNKAPSKRVAQHKLAQEVLKIVHGNTLATQAEQEHSMMFSKPITPNSQADADGNISTGNVNKAVPLANPDFTPATSLILPRSLVYNQPVDRVLYHAGLAASRSEGIRMVKQKGAYLGARPSATGTMGQQVDFSPATMWNGSETEKYIIGGDTLILRTGKWKVKVIKIISDKEFEEKGLSAPGWKDDKPEQPLGDDLQRMKKWNKRNYLKTAPLHMQPSSKDSVAKPSKSKSKRLSGGLKSRYTFGPGNSKDRLVSWSPRPSDTDSSERPRLRIFRQPTGPRIEA